MGPLWLKNSHFMNDNTKNISCITCNIPQNARFAICTGWITIIDVPTK
jgi:hypothetical protein